MHETPGLVGLVQEIVNRPGWDDNNEIAFIVTGPGLVQGQGRGGQVAEHQPHRPELGG